MLCSLFSSTGIFGSSEGISGNASLGSSNLIASTDASSKGVTSSSFTSGKSSFSVKFANSLPISLSLAKKLLLLNTGLPSSLAGSSTTSEASPFTSSKLSLGASVILITSAKSSSLIVGVIPKILISSLNGYEFLMSALVTEEWLGNFSLTSWLTLLSKNIFSWRLNALAESLYKSSPTTIVSWFDSNFEIIEDNASINLKRDSFLLAISSDSSVLPSPLISEFRFIISST